MKDEYNVFAENLVKYMEYYGISKSELAKKVGVAPSTITWWINGERIPRIVPMLKLVELFNCTQDELTRIPFRLDSVSNSQPLSEINKYISRLNEKGIANVLAYLEDLNPKFYEDGE